MVARRIAVLSTLLFLFLTTLTQADPPEQSPGTQNPPPRITPVPASLDALYPPRSQPVLLFAMHELNAALAGMVADLSENDPEGARASFESFRARYAKVAAMVPEWKDAYPTPPVEELARALAQGTPDEVMQATMGVGKVCHDCHLQTMVPVQFRYHWPDFSRVTVHDPVLDSDDDFAGFMLKMNFSLAGLGGALQQGQIDNARTHASQLQARMRELRESCAACHDTERAYFVDDGIMQILSGIESALQAPDPDPAVIASASQRLGQESCFRCHLVHVPAAFAQAAAHR